MESPKDGSHSLSESPSFSFLHVVAMSRIFLEPPDREETSCQCLTLLMP